MKLLKNKKSKLQEASKRLVNALLESGYITETEKQWLLYRIDAGDKTAYRDLRGLLLEMAEEINSTIY